MPAGVVNQWRNHPLVGSQFQKFLDEFLEDHAIQEQVTGNDPPINDPANPNKRTNPGPGPGPSPLKKARCCLDPGLVVDAESIDKAMLNECRIGAKEPPIYLQVRSHNHIYLLNKGSKDWVGNETPLGGFGKGSFKIIKQDADLPEGAVELDFSGSADQICYNGSLQSLGDVVKELRTKNPDCKVTYFKLTFDTENPNQFQLTRTHRVIFIPRPEEKASEMKEFNCAAKESMQVWKASNSVSVLWTMKFSAVKGLIPVKPGLFLKGSVTLSPGKALVVCKGLDGQ